MSEEKRTPISIYLTPRAAMILRGYSMGSGYGSLSRTVEEIILAFDAVYQSIKTFNFYTNALNTNPRNLSKDKQIETFLAILSLLQSINNSLSRLQPSTDETQITK